MVVGCVGGGGGVCVVVCVCGGVCGWWCVWVVVCVWWCVVVCVCGGVCVWWCVCVVVCVGGGVVWINSLCSTLSSNLIFLSTIMIYAIMWTFLYLKISMYQLQELFYTILGPNKGNLKLIDLIMCFQTTDLADSN